MTSSGSSKDLAKALSNFLQSPKLPLPAELNAIIASYLEKHDKPDEGSGERLGDELLAVWEKIVKDRPDKYAAFLAVLRELRPALRTPSRIFKWWDKLLDPVLEHVGREKGLAREVMDHTLDLLSADEYDDPTAWSEEGLAPLVNRLLSRWMEVRERQPHFRSSTELKDQMIKEALMAFGKRDPKGFMTALNGFVVKREHRNSALSLLCAFVSSGPPHLHLILQTPLFVNILHSLQKDESTATVNLALIALVMILPFIPSSVVPFLPTLFNIYARLLFWDRDSYFTRQHTEMGAENGGPGAGIPWDKSLLDPDYDGHSLSYLPEYFTILYGLYPINFLDYIRKPQRYLRHANNADDIDVQAMEIRDRSERFRKQHVLHPNFYNLTIESEKTDLSRWIKSEADEVLADCMALLIERTPGFDNVRPTTPARGASVSLMGDNADQEGFDSALLSSPGNVDASHQSLPPKALSLGRPSSIASHPSACDMSESRSRGPGGDSPTLPPHLVQSPSQTQLQDLIHSNKVIKSGLHQSLASDSVPSLLLNPQEHAAEKSPMQVPVAQAARDQGGSNAELGDQAVLFQHQRLLLINDLQYERFIKQQHMIHMGELRRKQIRVSATEAETQNLVMANRSLRQRLDEAKRGEAQIKKESDHRRNMAKKWETDLSNKLRALREEQKKWNAEASELRQQLEKAQAECESLRRIVDEAERKRLESEQDLVAVDISTAMIESLKGEIARLSASERAFQGKELKMETAMQAAAAAEARAKQKELELAAREEQLGDAERDYQAQIEDLKTQLAKALQEGQRKPSGDVAAVYEGALSTARAKNTELQKQYSTLMRKFTVAQSQLLDLQSSLPGSVAGGDSEAAPTSRSPIASRNRPHRGFSDTEAAAADGTPYSAASPSLEPPSSSVASSDHRPPTPAGLPGSGDSSGIGTTTSPHAERYFGRGGAQNAARKEPKDKKEKLEKKDKKSGGSLRGIRNFV
ncbi:Hamartin protein-domain-containing protein [Madurella fahalii]|uniref:Hamartin protein-domain-containing protein n=1 Tax=Madurella fahalii TaxID=1157608 RepID=A0ABQ0GMG9_9PEZI